MSAFRRKRIQSNDRARGGFSRGAVAAALIACLLIGAGATYVLAGEALNRTTTATKTLPAVAITSTKTVTVTLTRQAVESVASNGLRLSTLVNATDIIVGQKLNISVSVFNTLPTASGFFPQRSFEYSAPREVGNWTFYGIPVASWPICTSQFPFNWPLPISVVILNGNYTAQELPSIANTSFPIPCGSTAGIIPEWTFEPNSNLINVTYFADGGVGYRTLGLFRLATSFTASGYWNLSGLAVNKTSVCEPAVLDRCGLPTSTPFAPGVYTIGVADEWGQFNLLHFKVSGPG